MYFSNTWSKSFHIRRQLTCKADKIHFTSALTIVCVCFNCNEKSCENNRFMKRACDRRYWSKVNLSLWRISPSAYEIDSRVILDFSMSTATPLFLMVAALCIWSPNNGMTIIGVSERIDSVRLLRPPWVINAFTLGWSKLANISDCSRGLLVTIYDRCNRMNRRWF